MILIFQIWIGSFLALATLLAVILYFYFLHEEGKKAVENVVHTIKKDVADLVTKTARVTGLVHDPKLRASAFRAIEKAGFENDVAELNRILDKVSGIVSAQEPKGAV